MYMHANISYIYTYICMCVCFIYKINTVQTDILTFMLDAINALFMSFESFI